MIRLTHNHRNSPEEYDRIYKERAKGKVNWADKRRWRVMLRYFNGGYLLDIGCLDSSICVLAARIRGFIAAVGIDTAAEAIDEMNKKYKIPMVWFQAKDLFDVKEVDTYDYVCMGEVIEHLEKPMEAITHALSLVKAGGYLVISTPYNEAIEPGAVDGDRHIWSFTENDFYYIIAQGHDVRFKILGSRWFPRYRYCFKQLIIFIKKKG